VVTDPLELPVGFFWDKLVYEKLFAVENL